MDAITRGYRIYYEVEGEGEPIVLVPGLLTSIRSWRDSGYVDALRDRFRLILMDPLGHGGSDKPHDASAYDRDGLAAEIVAVMDAERLATANVWGYSRGGAMTVCAGEKLPERMRSIIVGGATVAPVMPESERAAAAERRARLDTARIAALRANDWPAAWRAQGIPEDDPVARQMAAENDSQAIAAAVEGFGQPGPRGDLSPLSGRILAYAGSRDLGLAAPGALETYRAGCDAIGARFELLDGLNHVEGFRRIDLVLPIVTDFLAGVPAS